MEILVSPIENLPENYEIIDYIWKQKEGDELKCIGRFIYIFIYIYIYLYIYIESNGDIFS